MKIAHVHYIVRKGWLLESQAIEVIWAEIEQAIAAITWPSGANGFYLDPSSRKGNGVKPIKEACVTYLKNKAGALNTDYDREEWPEPGRLIWCARPSVVSLLWSGRRVISPLATVQSTNCVLAF